jgi:murein DD-endopeptidase MepM/ murein hydrolase activator NlpD
MRIPDRSQTIRDPSATRAWQPCSQIVKERSRMDDSRKAGLLAAAVALTAMVATGPASADAAKLGARLLRPGAHGADVRQLQKSLNRLHFPTRADGAYGPGTRTSVLAYETARRFSADGLVQRKEGRQIRKQAAKMPKVTGASHGEVFPVPGPHTFGGADARFGAPRAGHIHQGQDILAACNSGEVSAHPGVVSVNSYLAAGDGYYIVIRSALTGEDFVYMHLARASWAAVGTTVFAGQQIGVVGATGDATGCHLHFEMWTVPGWKRGTPYDPLPTLQRWDAYS